MLLALLMVWLPNVVMAAEKSDDLQEFITKSASTLTRASDVIEVDLSQFTATTRTKTLEISTGKTYRFINGTLTAASTFKDFLLLISNNSTVSWSTDAIMQPRTLSTSSESTNALVKIDNGIFNLTGGKLNYYKTSDGNHSIYPALIRTTSTSSSNSINMLSGRIDGGVDCSNSLDKLYVYEGGAYVFYINSSALGAKIYYDANHAQIREIHNYVKGSKRNHVLISSSVKYGQLIFEDYNTSVNTDVVLAEGMGLYTLTSTDVSKMKYRVYLGSNKYDEDYEIYLENNQAKVRKKGEGVIKTADDLQARLNAIAAKGTATEANPETVEIAAAGITIGKYITVPEKCHALITGGPIGFSNTYVFGHAVFGLSKSSSLTFENISFNCITTGTWLADDYFISLGGNLTIGNNVVFKNQTPNSNVGLINIQNGGSLTYKSGNFFSAKTAVTGAVNSDYYGTVNILGGNIESNSSAILAKVVAVKNGATVVGSNTVVGCQWLYTDDKSTIKCTDAKGTCVSLGSQDAFSTGNFIGGKNQIEVREALYMSRFTPLTVYLCANAYLHTFVNKTATNNILTIDGDWANFALEKAFIKYVEPDEYKYYKFINIPDDREIYYNEKEQTVSIRKKVYDEDDLQNWINGGGSNSGKGTEDDPKGIDLPSGGCVINAPVDFGNDDDYDDLWWYINGKNDDGSNKDFLISEKGDVTIHRNTTLSLSNLNLSNTGTGYIYVSGTLIIDVNINIIRIYRLIRVLPGGRVIWKGGNGAGTDITKEFLYVETGGTLEYHGGTIGGGELGFHGYGTTYIYGGNIGGTKYGGYTYPSGITTISGGTISGGYFNDGKTTISGGTFIGGGAGIGGYVYWNGKGGTTTIAGGTFGTNGNGTIYNGGTLYLGGDGYTYDYIYNGASGRIYIIGKLNIIIRIHINITDIVLDTPIILGGSDYVLTAEDIKKIQIILPDGYTWRYDASRGGIIITSTTGIKDVTVDADNKVQYFDASGRKIEKLKKGLNIVKTSDGKIKKVIIQ